jgi:hypothetical protein
MRFAIPLIDRDVAELYGVETKRVNEAVANSLDKFPNGYVISVEPSEWENLRSKISTTNMSRVLPKAFTEKEKSGINGADCFGLLVDIS